MNFLASLLGGGNVIKEIGEAIDSTFTSDEERLEAERETMKARRNFDYLESKLVADQNMAQMEVNKVEAASSSFFVAGARPSILWIGAASLAYQFIIYPLMLWLPIETPPAPMDASMLYTIITGMLGVAGMRSFDKTKGTDTKQLRKSK